MCLVLINELLLLVFVEHRVVISSDGPRGAFARSQSEANSGLNYAPILAELGKCVNGVQYEYMSKKAIKLVSWNVNGIRAVMNKDLFIPFVKEENPDILCLQETKAMKGQAEIDLPEYEEIWNSAERKGYSGTAIFTKIKPISITFDLPGVKKGVLEDGFGDAITEGRVITMEFEKYFVVTVYTPKCEAGAGAPRLSS